MVHCLSTVAYHRAPCWALKKVIAYTEDVAELIAQHEVSYHLFADDKQLYTAVPSDEIQVARQRLTSCSKTELIWFGTRTSLRQLSSADRTLMIDSMDVK